MASHVVGPTGASTRRQGKPGTDSVPYETDRPKVVG